MLYLSYESALVSMLLSFCQNFLVSVRGKLVCKAYLKCLNCYLCDHFPLSHFSKEKEGARYSFNLASQVMRKPYL